MLENRKVIVELKTLTDDPSHKVEATADEHRGRKDWPLFYGTADVRKVLSNLSDGEAIYRKMVNAVGRSVETAVRSAEEQVTHTRSVLNLPDAAGVLVILNDSVDVLDPNVVGHRVVQLMRRTRTGNNKAERLDFVCLLFESHTMGVVQGAPNVPCFLIQGERKDRFPWFDDFYYDLVCRWASANGGIARKGEVLDPSAIKFVPMREAMSVPPAVLPKQEWWRRQYHARPHLREFSDDELLTMGANLMRRLAPCLVNGAAGNAAEQTGVLMEEFTHFIEEMNFRGLDMRHIPKK